MPLVSLKQITQDTWLRNGGGPSRSGVCYYMCNFIEGDTGIWNKPASFADAVNTAQNFGQGTAMMNYAKAQSLRKAPQIPAYPAVGGALTANSIYRVCLWVDKIAVTPAAPNHEILALTGNANDIVYFDPNSGFFQASNAGMNNRQALEFFINQQYSPAMHTANFQYLLVRSNISATPKGFKAN